MSDRERWIVYPLLFLALGTAFRGQTSDRVDVKVVDAKIVRCNQLQVTDEDGKPQVVLNSSPGRIVTYTKEGLPQVSIGSTPFRIQNDKSVESGIITVNGYDGKPVIKLRANYKAVVSKQPVRSEDADGEPKQEIVDVRGVLDGGGQIEVFGGSKRIAMALEYHPDKLGLFLRTPERWWPLAMKRAKRPPSGKPGSPTGAGPSAVKELPSAPEPSESPKSKSP